MLELQIAGNEFYDEVKGEFVSVAPQTLHLEHCLYAIAKWESKWKKAFLGQEKRHEKTQEEMIDYIRCMIMDDNVDPNVVYSLTKEQIERINEYMEDTMTATWFNDKNIQQMNKGPGSKEVITSDLIYYWLSASQIPFETEYWHFNRLMTLLKVASVKSQPSKKMSKRDVLRQNHALNQARRKPRT